MPKFAAYLFIAGGFAATVFFIIQSGFPNRELFIVFSIFFIIIGGFLIVQQKVEAFRKDFLVGNKLLQHDQLIKTGEKLRVNLSNCEIIEEGQQTRLLFTREFNGRMYTFMSEPANASADSVKKYLDDTSGVNLYVDPKNPANYYFDVYS